MTGLDAQNPGRATPRECIRAARDALNRAYECGGSRECWPFIMEALDWQRRAAEQLVAEPPRTYRDRSAGKGVPTRRPGARPVMQRREGEARS